MVVNKKGVLLAGDFETTVYDDQEETEVWSASYARLYSDKVVVHRDIQSFLRDLFDYRCNVMCWFHNLRFDGTFIIDYLLKQGWEFTTEKKVGYKQFKALISKENRWYSITLGTGKATIEIRDSAKLMPMTLDEVGKAFDTEHRKSTMEYKGKRYAGCPITKNEMEYIINDVLVLKEALEYMINENHTQLTIGSCALKEFSFKLGKRDYNNFFPKLSDIETPEDYGSFNVDEYIRKSYKGGFCYLRKDKKGRRGKGITLDVNSLYPSVMHSKSENYYPIGMPHFWRGEIPKEAELKGRVFFVRFKCRFELKKNHLPTVQIKGNHWYKPNEWLETSDVIYRGKRYRETYNNDGSLYDTRPTLTMTMVDWYLFNDHYNIEDLEILDGCWFYGKIGIFDDYIDHWAEKKANAKTKAERTEAKFFLNNLYGKFASSTDSSYRVPYINKDGYIELELVEEHNKEPGYIPVGSMVTSYARNFTIRHAQENYEAFCYADTDSLHLDDCDPINIDIHPTELLCWKRESDWSSAIFLRQKTYCEFIRKEDGKKAQPHWNVTCAGMPEKSKKIFLATRPITDFKIGLRVAGKLTPKRIPGGVILKEGYFTIK